MKERGEEFKKEGEEFKKEEGEEERGEEFKISLHHRYSLVVTVQINS